MKKNLIQFLKIVFFLSIGLFSIWWFLHTLTPEQRSEIWKTISGASYGWLLLSMVVGFFSHLTRAVRWNLLIEPTGHSPKIKDTFAAVAIGYLGNFLIPRFGEFARCVTLKKQAGVPVTTGFGTVIVERMLDMFVFLLIFILGFFFFVKQAKEMASGYLSNFITLLSEKQHIIILAFFIFLVVVILIYFFRRQLKKIKVFSIFFGFIEKFTTGLTSIFRLKKWLLFLVYTVLMWLLYFLMTWLCFFSLPETSSLPVNAGFAILAFGTIGIIVVQGGIGVFPLIVAETLALFGIVSTIGYAMGWLIWLSQTVTLLIIGIIAFAYLMFSRKFSIHDIRINPKENSN